jgi:hypothetical protein
VAWRKVLCVKAQPGMLARRHLEVCVFSQLAAELRSGDVAVTGSDSYANLNSQLMSWQECAPLAARFCEQAGIPTEAADLVAYYKAQLTRTATEVDAGYPANTDLVLEQGKPVLKRRKGADRRPSALALEQAIHQRLPERSLLDILTRAAYLTGWPRHLGPASGSDPKIRGDARAEDPQVAIRTTPLTTTPGFDRVLRDWRHATRTRRRRGRDRTPPLPAMRRPRR